MLPSPQRLDVLKALTQHLQGITPANVYEFTTGQTFDMSVPNSVVRGRSVFGGDDPLPLISILESSRSDAGQFAGESERKESWPLLIQGWVNDDIANPTDPAYYLMAAVEHRLRRLVEVSPKNGEPLYPDEYMLGGLIANLTVPPGVVRPPMEGISSKAFFYLPIRLTLVSDE